MPSCHWKGYIFSILLLLFPIVSATVNFSQCLTDVIDCAQNSSICTLGISNTTALSVLRTSQGKNVTSADAATAISYSGCNMYCGTGEEAFSWNTFAQEYAAWLLPYLALVSQLPFGADNRLDNLMSAILTLGSPTLSGYCLFMMLLNARWVNNRLFARINYPSASVRHSVVQVLTGLQQVPLRIYPGESAHFESLVVHPDNDQFWCTFAEELDFSHKWSIASATSIAWVVIAYLLSVADSISSVTGSMESNAQGTGSAWLWLLPIVTGWLILSPKCDFRRVRNAYRKANKHMVVAGSNNPADATHVRSNLGLTISPSADWLEATDITSPDESRIPPVYNYARIFSWYRNAYVTSLYYRAAWRKSSRNQPTGVDGQSIRENLRDIPPESRRGTREQITSYCQPDEREYTRADILWPPGLLSNMMVASIMSLQLQWGTTGAAFLVDYLTPTTGLGCRSSAYLIYGMLSTAVWLLLVSSSALGYYAHHVMEDEHAADLEGNGQSSDTSSESPLLPTVGLAKKVLGSSARRGDHLAVPMREVHPPNAQDEGASASCNDSDARTNVSIVKQPRPMPMYVRIVSWTANLLRWIGKTLAIVNAIGIIANSIFQYAGVYRNCYCNSSVITWGAAAYNVINLTSSDVSFLKSAWLGGLALSLASCAFFLLSIFLARDPSS